MGIVYPGGIDSFSTPSASESTPTSEAGDSSRNHTELHHDINLAVVALETNTAQINHVHSGAAGQGPKLTQANTHQSVDTDAAPASIHHTLDGTTGTSANKAAPANHVHDYNDGTRLLNRPYFLCTSLTRPTSPVLGTMIYESDTNRVRVWAQFPGQSTPIWQLLAVGSIPVLRMEAQVNQTVPPTNRYTCFFSHIIEDIFAIFGLFHPPSAPPRNVGNVSDIIVPETGHYLVNTRFHWHPQFTFHDHSMIELTVNGVDIGRKDWEFIRGFDNTPGFGQTNSIHMLWYFNAGDVLRVHVKHNANSRSSILWCNNVSPDKQISYVELHFQGP